MLRIAALLLTVALLAAPAHALNYTFSFADPVGTVNGRILGLSDNLNNQAAQVVVDSWPDPPFTGFGGVFGGAVTSWSGAVFNEFDVAGGDITRMAFFAWEGPWKFWLQTQPFENDPPFYAIEFDPAGDGCLDIPCISVRSEVITVTPTEVPEASSVLALALGLGLFGAGALLRR